MERALAPTGGARGRAWFWAAQRTWLAILAGQRLAHRPARTPSGCGLAKSAFFFGRFAPLPDALRELRGLNPSIVRITDPAMMFSLLLLASVVPAGQSFTCTPVAVWDGDGPIWCTEGPHIRLSGVAAREMDGSCSPGHPCPNADPVAARDHLVGLLGSPQGRNRSGHILVRGPAMHCVSRGGAGGTRTAAFCTSPRSGDISCAMVRSGLAARWAKYWDAHRCD